MRGLFTIPLLGQRIGGLTSDRPFRFPASFPARNSNRLFSKILKKSLAIRLVVDYTAGPTGGTSRSVLGCGYSCSTGHRGEMRPVCLRPDQFAPQTTLESPA